MNTQQRWLQLNACGCWNWLWASVSCIPLFLSEATPISWEGPYLICIDRKWTETCQEGTKAPRTISIVGSSFIWALTDLFDCFTPEKDLKNTEQKPNSTLNWSLDNRKDTPVHAPHIRDCFLPITSIDVVRLSALWCHCLHFLPSRPGFLLHQVGISFESFKPYSHPHRHPLSLL